MRELSADLIGSVRPIPFYSLLARCGLVVPVVKVHEVAYLLMSWQSRNNDDPLMRKITADAIKQELGLHDKLDEIGPQRWRDMKAGSAVQYELLTGYRAPWADEFGVSVEMVEEERRKLPPGS